MMSFAPRGGGSAGSKESRDPEEAGGVSELHQDLTTSAFFSFFLSFVFIFVDSWKKHEYSLSPREKRGVRIIWLN
mgnify:CR=1 FL=1